MMGEHQNSYQTAKIGQTDDQQGKEQYDADWDEASIARLLGFDEDLVEQSTEQEAFETTFSGDAIENDVEVIPKNVIAQDELFDDPQLGKTQPTLASNPFAKFGVVGLGLLVVFGAGGIFLNSVMSNKLKVAPKIAKDSPKAELAINKDVKPEEVETGKLKAELALGSQAEKIKSVEQAKSPKNSADSKTNLNKPTVTKEVSTKACPVEVSSTPAPTPASSYPRRFTSVSQPQPVHQSVSPRLAKQSAVAAKPLDTRSEIAVGAVKTNAPSDTLHSTQSSKAPEKEPMEQWMAMNRLGSYGSVEIPTNTVFAAEEQLENSTSDTVASEKTTSPITIKSAAPVLASSGQPVNSVEPLSAEETAIITGVPVRRLTVGATVSGQLVTPVVWADSKSNFVATKSITPTEGEKFIVELTEPLTEEDNFITLPQGTQIVAQVIDIHESGLIQLEATQIVIDGAEYVLPPGAVSIRGISGQPLMASKWSDKGSEIASRDTTAFAFGSLAKVGEVLNQPQEEQSSASTGLGGTTMISSTKRGRPNILGAILEGGFKPLTEQILERNEQELKEIQEREEVWYVRAGTNVQVFVNQSFEL